MRGNFSFFNFGLKLQGIEVGQVLGEVVGLGRGEGKPVDGCLVLRKAIGIILIAEAILGLL